MHSGQLDLGHDIQFSYLDSGAPLTEIYTTLFVIHGSCFTNAVFKRLLPLGPQFNIRIIAPNRRGYPGTSPYSSSELTAFSEESSEDVKAAFVRERGIELLNFIAKFYQINRLPSVSGTGKDGGIAILGWSLGTALTFSAVANLSELSEEVREMIVPQLRAHILLEPAGTILSVPLHPGTWLPFRDPLIPIESRGPFFAYLVTSYFDHPASAFTNRNPAELSQIVPSTDRIPSIYNMTKSEQHEIILVVPEDLVWTKLFAQPTGEAYRKACFSPISSQMTTWEIAGNKSYSLSWSAFWAIQKEDNERGLVRFKIMEGVNHFMHWDEPEMTMRVLREILDGNQNM